MSMLRTLRVRWLLWKARAIDKLNRLDAITPLSIGATQGDAEALYGNPYESEPVKGRPEAICHTFWISPFHQALVTIWNGRIHQVAYLSSHPDPGPDLAWMLSTHSDGLEWTVMTPGYSYRRSDGARWLWCSAASVIGVSSGEFMAASAENRHS